MEKRISGIWFVYSFIAHCTERIYYYHSFLRRMEKFYVENVGTKGNCMDAFLGCWSVFFLFWGSSTFAMRFRERAKRIMLSMIVATMCELRWKCVSASQRCHHHRWIVFNQEISTWKNFVIMISQRVKWWQRIRITHL